MISPRIPKRLPALLRRLPALAVLLAGLAAATIPADAAFVPNTYCSIEATNQIVATVRIMCRLRGFKDTDCSGPYELGYMECWLLSYGAQLQGGLGIVKLGRCQQDTGWVLGIERHFTRAEYDHIGVRGVLMNYYYGGYAEPTGDCLLPEVPVGQYKRFTVYVSGHLDRDLEVDKLSCQFVPAIDCADKCNVCRYRPCPAGAGNAKVGSVDYRVSLGWGSFGKPAGQLEVQGTAPTPSLARPLGVSLSAGDGLAVVTNQDGALRQVLSPQALADIVPVSEHQYEIRFYHAATLGPPVNDLYQPADPPFSVTTVEDPDRGTNLCHRLRITESQPGALRQHDYQYDPAQQQWSLATGAGAVLETSTESWNAAGTERTDTQEVRNEHGDLVQFTQETWRVYPWGTNLVEQIAGTGPDSRTNRWTYYDDVPPASGSYGRLRSKTEPSGYWERYEYDSQYRLVKTIAPFLDADETAPDDQCRVTTISHSATAPHTTVVVTLLGHEIERRYRVSSATETIEIQCVTPGAAWDDPANLVTVTRRHAAAPNRAELAAILQPDGTGRLYQYATAATAAGPAKTTTITAGALNADRTAVTNGTRTVTTVNSTGEILQETIQDIATGLLLHSRAAITTDLFGRVTASVSPAGTNTVTYDCCGISETVDEEGIATVQQYDALGRVTGTLRNGITAAQTYDAAGHVTAVSQTGRDGQSLLHQQLRYDTAGQIVQQQTGPQAPTLFHETLAPAGGSVRTVTLPGGATQVETRHRDGRLQRVAGTAAHGRRYEYGVAAPSGETNTTPRYYVREILLRADGTDSAECATTWHDLLGRPFLLLYADGATARHAYNTRGQLERVVDPDGVTTLHAYDDQGQLEYTALDVNRNGLIDFAGPDRITRTRHAVVQAHDTVVRRTITSVWAEPGVDAESVVLVTDSSADGRQSWSIRNGQTNHTVAATDPSLHRQTLTTTSADGAQQVDLFENGLLTATTVHDADAVLRVSRRFSYDGHDRLVAVLDELTGAVSSNQYDAAGQLVGLVRAAPGLAPQTRSLAYDASGRLASTTLPGSAVLAYEYLPTGELQRSTGSGTYPVDYAYDYAGRLQSITTWHQAATSAGAATTTWEYHPQRGFLTAKQFPDGRGPAYSYTPAGRRLLRISPRGIVTSNAFNAAGDLVAVHHTDTTPAALFQYDRRGRIAAVANGPHAAAYLYSSSDALLRETHTAGPLAGLDLAYAYDALDRRTNLTAAGAAFTLDPIATRYTPAGRALSVEAGPRRATYSYDPSGTRIAAVALDHGTAPLLAATRAYDGLGRLTNLSYQSDPSYPSYSYSYNSADRRAQVAWPDGSAWTHAYDSQGRLTAASRQWADGSPVAGQQFAWTYDDAGNRLSSTINHQPSAITHSLLNQPLDRTVPPAAAVIGVAAPTATVTVNNQPTARHADYFHAAVPVTNTTAAAYPDLRVLAVQNNATPTGEDAIAEHAGRAFVPQTPETYTHDADGNLTQDGRWTYAWDAFNRLATQETRADLPAEVPRRRLEFSYDHLHRRTRKLVSAENQGQWTPIADTRYVYDGWTLLAELDALASPAAPALARSYLWGPDLGGTFRGLGGAGGLVAVTSHHPTPQTHYALADAAGNITALVDAESGQLSAQYEYAPFGSLLRATGPAAALNPIRHASKLADPETGLVYYGHRYYSPELGRWLSRDPLAENGGLNLYSFLGNDPINLTDPTGLAGFFFDGTWNYTDSKGQSVKGQARPTNVWKLWRAYNEPTKIYYGGVGNAVEHGYSKWWWLGGLGGGLAGSHDQLLGGISGYGGQKILAEAFGDVVFTYNHWDKIIDIFGFSRGGALALEFANMIDDGIPVQDDNRQQVYATTKSGKKYPMKWCDVEIRFIGLFDVVGSFGVPGNMINYGYRLHLPRRTPVGKAVHAIALDEHRDLFPVTNVRGALQVGFRGAHSDIGGSYFWEGLSNTTLTWMLQQARSAGVKFDSIYDGLPLGATMGAHNSDTWYHTTGNRKFPPDMIIDDSALDPRNHVRLSQ